MFRGNEERLEDCLHAPWGLHDCDHGRDVAIACSKSTLDQGILLFSTEKDLVCFACTSNELLDQLFIVELVITASLKNASA